MLLSGFSWSYFLSSVISLQVVHKSIRLQIHWVSILVYELFVCITATFHFNLCWFSSSRLSFFGVFSVTPSSGWWSCTRQIISLSRSHLAWIILSKVRYDLISTRSNIGVISLVSYFVLHLLWKCRLNWLSINFTWGIGCWTVIKIIKSLRIFSKTSW